MCRLICTINDSLKIENVHDAQSSDSLSLSVFVHNLLMNDSIRSDFVGKTVEMGTSLIHDWESQMALTLSIQSQQGLVQFLHKHNKCVHSSWWQMIGSDDRSLEMVQSVGFQFKNYMYQYDCHDCSLHFNSVMTHEPFACIFDRNENVVR